MIADDVVGGQVGVEKAMKPTGKRVVSGGEEGVRELRGVWLVFHNV